MLFVRNPVSILPALLVKVKQKHRSLSPLKKKKDFMRNSTWHETVIQGMQACQPLVCPRNKGKVEILLGKEKNRLTVYERKLTGTGDAVWTQIGRL